MIGDYPDKYFTDKDALKAMAQFKDDLFEYENHLKKRNEDLTNQAKQPYVWLLPEKVTASTVI